MRYRWFYAFFVVSGFCGLVHEVVWIRLAMAAFGATTPAVSIVLSVFMAGLALGSVLGGRLARSMGAEVGLARPLRFYATAELVIAVSAAAVPLLLELGRRGLLSVERGSAWGSAGYYAASGAWIALSLLPFCVAMGATYPLAMAAMRVGRPEGEGRSFSYLYLANVLGATVGTLASAYLLIEILGFRRTLAAAATLNATLALLAVVLASRAPRVASRVKPRSLVNAPNETQPVEVGDRSFRPLVMLLSTGLVSMAMEVVWTRQFTPYLGTFVYAFAGILAIYLGATFLGSAAYRKLSASLGPGALVQLRFVCWGLAGSAGLLPLVSADPRLPMGDGALGGVLRVALGIAVFCSAMGFLTPMLVDRFAAGDPERAGRAYAVNVVGCILGPLLAGFLLLPQVGERLSLVVLALPLFALAPLAAPGVVERRRLALTRRAGWVVVGLLGCAVAVFATTRDYETVFSDRKVLRDYEATVIATGSGMEKRLLVNGYGMTILTPITKMMVHFPLALRPEPPRDVLVICFGMGTSFRSAMSWGSETTAVELVPSVPRLFGYYHADGPGLLRSPRAHIVIDDGRRFLERTAGEFDAVVIDPPPPVEAAGSSLLYSRDFLRVIKRRLRPHGVLQHWLPEGDPTVIAAVTRALTETFTQVRVFRSLEGWGFHFICNDSPLPLADAQTLAARLPAEASQDLLEWGPGKVSERRFAKLLGRQLSVKALLEGDPKSPAISDDRPVNEYFLLRSMRARQ